MKNRTQASNSSPTLTFPSQSKEGNVRQERPTSKVARKA